MTHEAGKGSKRRPTNEHAFGNNYDNIFGDKNVLHILHSVPDSDIHQAASGRADSNAQVPDHNEPA